MTGYTGWRPMPPGRYRSQGESYVARALDRARVAYRYEPRLVLAGHDPGYQGRASVRPSGDTIPEVPTPYYSAALPGVREYWVRPDFYLPQHHAVIEYAGRMDLPGYRQRHREKVRLYEHNAISCYEVFPEDLRRPYWAPRLMDAIEDCLRPTPGRSGSSGQAVPDTIERLIHRSASEARSSSWPPRS